MPTVRVVHADEAYDGAGFLMMRLVVPFLVVLLALLAVARERTPDSADIVMINRGFSVERWRPLSNCVEVIEAADVSASGLVRDAPPAVILAAARKLFAAQSRDHR